jgi:uncharacterized protein
MEPSLTDTLCTRCGLCCDGSLFADVELVGSAEANRLEIMGLDVEDDGGDGSVLQLPCAALSGTRCSIYAHRPRVCRTFECHLLQSVRRGKVSVEDATARIDATLGQIRRVKDLLGPPRAGEARLPLEERCAEALAADARTDPKTQRNHAELAAAMTTVERSIRSTFLGNATPGRAGRPRRKT